jgi:hypothetical protein
MDTTYSDMTLSRLLNFGCFLLTAGAMIAVEVAWTTDRIVIADRNHWQFIGVCLLAGFAFAEMVMERWGGGTIQRGPRGFPVIRKKDDE